MDHSAEAARELVVSYCFPPYSDTAAIVAGKRVRVAGEQVDVIHNAMDRLRRRDEGLLALTDGLVQRRHAVPSSTWFKGWASIRDFCELGLQTALEWDRSAGGYERMYSRAHFAASHFLAARLALLRPQLTWTAEFSDPLSLYVTGEGRSSPTHDDPLLGHLRAGLQAAGFQAPESGNALEWSEVLAFALADRLIFTNEHQRSAMLDRVEPALADRVMARSTIAPHPTLGPEFYAMADPTYELDPARRHIAYFGNFYATRGLDVVLDALASLPQALRDRLCLHVFTSDPKKAEGPLRDRGLDDVVRLSPFVDYLDFLALTTRFDCLLVNDADTRDSAFARNPFLPSKWSDYAGSGTSVWGILEDGSALSGMDMAYTSPVQHRTAAVQVLARVAASEARPAPRSPENRGV